MDENVAKHGHPSVACLTHEDDAMPVGERHAGWQSAMPVGERHAGWQSAMRATGLADERLAALTVRAPIDRAGASSAVAAWLVTPDRPSAVVGATDERAFGLLHRAALVGVRIPEDLAVVAFEGVRESAMTVLN
ncbi:MAG: substrate-binding domain-containing protein [Nakamurella sp.]